MSIYEFKNLKFNFSLIFFCTLQIILQSVLFWELFSENQTFWRGERKVERIIIFGSRTVRRGTVRRKNEKNEKINLTELNLT